MSERTYGRDGLRGVPIPEVCDSNCGVSVAVVAVQSEADAELTESEF